MSGDTSSLPALDVTSIAVGDALPVFDLTVTASVIVAGAIATRDFMPVHHDHAYAKAQGAPDIFMNILTTNGYIARYLTDWAGPDAIVKRISVRLGAPCIPGHTLRFTGTIERIDTSAGEVAIEVAYAATNAFGAHASGIVALTVPAPTAG